MSAASAAIGDRVAALVKDGATLQLGIGAVPDAVLAALAGRRGLRVWSEMFSDGVPAVIALPYWHPKADVSTVVSRLTGPVTSFQHSLILSDQGTAAIWG